MTEKIRSAIEACSESGGSASHALRSLMVEDPEGFLRASASLLAAEPDSPGHNDLLRLLAASDPAVRCICDPGFFSCGEAASLARLLAAVDPQLESKLLELIPREKGSPNDAAVERVLSLLEAASPSARIVPALAHLLHDPNPRLRAKVALLLGRRVHSVQFVEGRMQETDARVRANAVEALWDVIAADSAPVLWLAVRDENNRVAGNALLALYRAEDRSAIPCILSMAADPRPAFRATAAWVMGQTADPRFLPALELLERDLYALVRRNAAKSIVPIRRRAAGDALLELHVLRAHLLKDSIWPLSVQALEPGGSPARGLLSSQFILWQGSELVTGYEVAEHDATDCLAVGIAVCLDGAEPAVAACLEQKPPNHLWSIARFSAGAGAKDPAAAYRSDPKTLKAALAEPAAPACPFRSMLPALLRVEGGRHLILLADSELAPSEDVEPLIASAFGNNVAIHAVIVGAPSAALKAVCDGTGGFIFSVSEAAGSVEALCRLYSALSNRYRILYSPEPGDAAGSDVVRIQVYAGDRYGECSAVIRISA